MWLVIDMTAEEFERAVADALDGVPEELARMMSNVAVLVEDEAPDDRDLLGLYEGTPLTERDEWWAAGSLPDRITIFRNPILRICDTRDDVVAQVEITVVHEIAHHFGIDDARLHDLGWA
jgi:predicted Zn-dependent protease with MMP-like domain